MGEGAGKGKGELKERITHLTRAHLIKRDEGERLGEHSAREVSLREGEGDEEGAEEELRDEGEGFEMQVRV